MNTNTTTTPESTLRSRLEAKAKYMREMERIAALSALEGVTLYTGSSWTWGQWSRVAWLVRDGLAYPQFRQNYWKSVPGRRVTLTSLSPEPIRADQDTLRISGMKATRVLA